MNFWLSRSHALCLPFVTGNNKNDVVIEQIYRMNLTKFWLESKVKKWIHPKLQFYTCMNIFHDIWAASIHIAHNGTGNRIRTPLLTNTNCVVRKIAFFIDKILTWSFHFVQKNENIVNLLPSYRRFYFIRMYALSGMQFHLWLCQG